MECGVCSVTCHHHPILLPHWCHSPKEALRSRPVPPQSFPPKPFLTDNGNYIVDVFRTAAISDAAAVAEELKKTCGVIEHGLFVALEKSIVLVGHGDGRVSALA